MKNLYAVRSFLLVMLVGVWGTGWGQTTVQNFGTGTGSNTSQTAVTNLFPNPTSGTTYARAGATAPNAPIVVANTGNPLGTTGSYVRAVASSSTSVSKVSPVVGYTGSTEFYTSFKVLFGDASASNTATSGSWTFAQGPGTTPLYADANQYTSANVFAGLRFTYGASGAITISYDPSTNASFTSTGLTTSSLTQGTVYKIEIVGNNKGSGTISYTYNGAAQTVAIQTYDLYINGTRIGNDLAYANCTTNANITSITLTGISSASNVANIFLDDVVVYNVVPGAIGTAPATQIAVNAGNNQSAAVGTSVSTLPSVIVKDASNNPVSGVSVIFAVATGGGSATGLSATTNASGIATVGSWTLGTTAGSNTLTATSTGLTGSPVTFTATGTTGVATQIAVNAGNNQSSVAGSSVTTAPSVIVKDAYNNPVNGVDVTFAVATGGGSATGLLAITNASGIATVGSWTLGTTAGVNTLTATSGSLTGSPVTFTATATPGAANAIQSTLTPTSANIAADGTSLQVLTVQAKDVNGNNLTTGGLAVTITKLSGTGTIGSVSDNGNGTYTATVTSATSAGSGVFVATLGGSAVQSGGGSQTQATVTYLANAPAASQSTLTPTTSSIVANGISTQVLTVQAKDASGINVSTGGSTVTITKLSGAGTIGSVTDNANGTYTATVTAPSTTGSGVFVATLGGSAVQSGGGSQTQSTITYIAGAANAGQSTLTPTSASIVANGSSTQVLTVQAKDANGNTITTGGLTVTITKLSGTGTIGSVTDNSNGTYTATVTAPSSTGSGVFVATLGGSAVQSGGGSQTQSTVTYIAGVANAVQSTLTPTSAGIVANGSGTKMLTVRAKDANGNNLTTGGLTVTITKLSGTGTISGVTDNNDGTYTATVTAPTATGSGVFVATLGGSAVQSGGGSQTQSTITYVAAAANANRSTLTPTSAGIVANGSSTQVLTVQAKDANSNNVTIGGSTVTITKVSGTGTISGVTDNNDGTYTATVTAPLSTGSGVFVATLNGSAVQSGGGSQTQSTITYIAGAVNAGQSTLTPTSASIVANGSSTQVLTVQAKDANGNTITTGGSTVTITKLSGTGTIGLVTDNANGTYTATVTAPSATGSGVFVATLGGSAVQSGGGSQSQSTITYAPVPLITTSVTALAAFTTTAGTASTAQAFTVSGSNLLADIILTPPSGYEVSQTSATAGFGSTQTITQSGGTVNATVYVRLTSAAAAGSYSGNVSLTTTSAVTKNVSVTGTVNATCLSQANFTGTPSGWTQTSITYGSNEAIFGSSIGELITSKVAYPNSLTFDLRRTNNSSDKTFYVEVSTTTQNGSYTIVATYDLNNTVPAGTTNCTVDLSAYLSSSSVYIRFRKASSTTSPWYLKNVQFDCSAPAITVSGGPITSVNTIYGTASPSPTSFTLTGTGLSSNISLAAVTGFEYSTTSGGPYSSTLSLPAAGGNVFVRLTSAASVGTYSGSIVASSGSTSVSIPLASSTVSPAPLTITANNESKCEGQTFTFAGTEFTTSTLYNGNAVTAVSLTSPGAGSGASSGTYSIIPSSATGAGLANYIITYTNGTLTVTSLPTVYNVTATGSHCEGVGLNIGLDNSQSGVSYQLKLGGSNTGSPVTGTGSAITFGSQTAEGTYTVLATNSTTSCTQTMNGSETINPTPVAPIITAGGPTTFCTGGSVVLSSDRDSPNNWYKDGSPIPGATNKTYTATTSGTYTDVITNASGCSSTSNAITVTVTSTNTWTGVTSTDWSVGSNWCSGSVPDGTTDAIVPSGASRYPVLSVNSDVNALQVQSGASITLSGKTFTINGDVSGMGVLTGSVASKLVIGGAGGSGILYFDQTDSITNSLDSLALTRTNGNIGIGNKLNLLNVLNVNAGGTLNPNGNLVLRSTDSTKTARVAPVTGSIVGDVTVERYISSKRAYRFITPPVTTSQSIQAAWMEGQHNASTAYANNSNTKPGYGTHITGSGGSTNGFDQTVTNNPSLFVWDNGTGQAYSAVSNVTSGGTLIAGKGYRLFVRGSRGVDLSNNAATPSSTILRVTGGLITGTVTFNTTSTVPLSGLTQGYSFLGNPYASPVKWSSLQRTDVTATYSTFDPRVNVRGAFVYYNASGHTNSNLSSKVNDTLQSGQGFFVQNVVGASNPSLVFKETNKVIGNNPVFRSPEANTTSLSVRLLLNNSLGIQNTADGVVALFDDAFSTDLGDEDSYKYSNLDENIAIRHGVTDLSIEGRPNLVVNDTLQLKIWQYRQSNYLLRFDASHFNAGATIFVKDAYLNTETQINSSDSTVVPFNLTLDSASFAEDRFMIVLKPGSVLPVTITDVKAYQKGKGIQVDWISRTETNIARYEVEKSANGRDFEKAGLVTATGNSSVISYGWFDENPVEGNNFYRIRIVEKSGAVKYTQVVKVTIGKGNSSIAVYPNPVKGNAISLHFVNMQKGRYTISLYNNLGQQVMTREIEHEGASATYSIPAGRLISKGTYRLTATNGETEMNTTVIFE